MMRLQAAAVLAAGALAGACTDLAGDDWLVGEARSPDGKRIAHLWCEDLCDVAGRLTLTVSPASRTVPIRASGVDGFPPEGEMPEADRIATFRAAHIPTAAEPEGVETRISWSGNDGVQIAGPCLSGLARNDIRDAIHPLRLSIRNLLGDERCEAQHAR